MNGRTPTLGEIARLSCLGRLFAVLFAFFVFSALPGMAPLVATYGHLASDSVGSGPTALIATTSGSPEKHSEAPRKAGSLLLAGHWRSLSLIVAYEFDSDAFLAPTATSKRHDYYAVTALARRSYRVGATAAFYDAQGPPSA